MVKKITALILCAVLVCAGFSSCSSVNTDMTEENITKTVDKAFDALKSFDTKNLDKYVKSSTLSMIISYAEKHSQFQKLGASLFNDLSYEITNIDIENATVTLDVQNKDLTEAASDFASELKNKYSTIQLLAKLSDEKFLDSNLSALNDDIANASMSDGKTTITLSIEKGSKNLVLSFDADAENAVSGGALSAIKSIYALG